MMNKVGRDITVVVCTYNRVAMLRLALTSLMAQIGGTDFRYEILLIDDGSTDGTGAFVQDFVRQCSVPIRYLRTEGLGVAAARSLGVREAAGDWIAFFDDDQVADPAWLWELWRTARVEGVYCAGGRVKIRFHEVSPAPLSPITRAVLGESDYGDGLLFCTRKTFPGTGNVIIHRLVFAAVGNFDESLVRGGEDLDLFRRIRQAGFRACYVPDAVVYHLTPAYRLQEDYLYATSRRNGDNFAVRDYREWGPGKTLLSCLGRLAQGVVCHVPALLLSYARRDGHGKVGRKCLLWRMEGYVRGTLFLLAPSLFPQDRFFNRLDFRAQGRNLASPPESP